MIPTQPLFAVVQSVAYTGLANRMLSLVEPLMQMQDRAANYCRDKMGTIQTAVPPAPTFAVTVAAAPQGR